MADLAVTGHFSGKEAMAAYSAAYMDFYSVLPETVLYANYAGVPGKPGYNNSIYSGFNTVCETIKEMPVLNFLF